MADFAAACLNMVESQVRTQDVTDVRIQDAMRLLPRETFVPADKAYLAYADIEVEYAPGRWLLKPRDVAKLLQALRPMPGERALAISAPYAAAVIETLGGTVTRVEAGADLPAGTFDLVVCEGAVARAPQAWLDAVGLDGRLGVVDGTGRWARPASMSAQATASGGANCLTAFRQYLPGLSRTTVSPFRCD